jgi:hypothetical protein
MDRSQAQRWVASRHTQRPLSHRTLRHPDERRTTEQSKETLRNARIPRKPLPQPPPPSNQSAATRTHTARHTQRTVSSRRGKKDAAILKNGRRKSRRRPEFKYRERTRAENQPSMRRDVQEARKDVGSSEEARTGEAGRRWSAAERGEERPRDGSRGGEEVGRRSWRGIQRGGSHTSTTFVSLCTSSAFSLLRRRLLSISLRFFSLHLLPLITCYGVAISFRFSNYLLISFYFL